MFTLYYAAEAFCVHSSVMRWGQAGKKRGFVRFSSLTHALHVHLHNPCALACRQTHSYMHTRVSLLYKNTCTSHTHTETLWVSELWQPVISFNPFIMFLFSFPLFGEKGECKQEFRYTKKNTQPQAEKTRDGNFLEEEGHLCAETFVHRCLARRRETVLFIWLCYIYVCVTVVLPLAHADQWTKGSSLCRSLDPQVRWLPITHCERL